MTGHPALDTFLAFIAALLLALVWRWADGRIRSERERRALSEENMRGHQELDRRAEDRFVDHRFCARCEADRRRELEQMKEGMREWREANRSEHSLLFGRLDELKSLLMNPNGKKGG